VATATVLEADIIPETNVSAEAPAKASFWQRAKNRALDIAKRIASPVKAAAVKTATTVKRAAKAVVAKVRGTKAAVRTKFGAKTKFEAELRAAKRAEKTARLQARFKTATSSAGSWIRDTWNRVLKPFLKLRGVVFGIVFGIVGLVAAPLTTILVVFGTGAFLWSLSYLVEHLESSTSRSARFALKAIEAVAQLIKGLVYVATFALTIAFCATSVAFAVTEVLELVLRYFDVEGAVWLSSVAYFVLTGNWAFLALIGLMTLMTLKSNKEAVRPRSVDQQTVKAPQHNRRTKIEKAKGWDKVETAGGSIPHADEPRQFVFADAEIAEAQTRVDHWKAELKNVEKVARDVARNTPAEPRCVKLPKCTACGIDDGGARYGLRNHKGICGECFKKLDEEDALKAAKKGKLTKADLGKMREAGVKVPAKVVEAVKNQPANCRVTLTLEEISNLSAVANSRDDLSKVYWAETAWWYDRNGTPHVREWLGFVDGKSVACVEYQHEKANRGYAAWVLAEQKDDDRKVGVFHTLTKAHEVLADELSDQANLIGGMLDALREEMPAAEPAKVLEFVEVNEFESPEAHIEHVRKTKGEAAAAALEEQYLQTMIAAEKTS